MLSSILFLLLPLAYGLLLYFQNLAFSLSSLIERVATFFAVQLLLCCWLALYFSLSTSIFSTNFILVIFLLGVFIGNQKKRGSSKLTLIPGSFRAELGKWHRIYYVLIPGFLGLAAVNMFNTSILGDDSWDGNRQHLPIVLSIFQMNSIENLPQIQNLQQIPALSHVYSSIWLNVFPSFQILTIPQSLFIFMFVAYSITILFDLYRYKYVSARAVLLGKVALLSSSPILMTFGSHQIDFFSQFYLLLFARGSVEFLKIKSVTLALSGKLAVAGAALVSSKISSIYSLVTIIILVALIQIYQKQLKKVLQVTVIGTLALGLGSVFFLRNFIEFKNPVYPYEGFAGFKFANYLITMEQSKSSALAVMQNSDAKSNALLDLLWNWFWPVTEFLRFIFSNAFSFLGIEQFKEWTLPHSFSQGNGIVFTCIFILGIFSFLAVYLQERLTVNYILWLVIPIVLGLSVNGIIQPRFLWVASFSLLIICLIFLSKVRRLESISLFLVLICGLISLGYSGLKSLDQFNQAARSSLTEQVFPENSRFFKVVGGNPSLMNSSDCSEVFYIGGNFSFTSILWMNKTCTQVQTTNPSFSRKTENSYVVYSMDASEKNLRCALNLGPNNLAILDRFSVAITFFEKNSSITEFKNHVRCRPEVSKS